MKKIKVNPKWFRHEVLHTTWIVLDTAFNHLQKHQYYKSGINPKFNKAIDKSIESLNEAYTSVGLNRQNEIKKTIKVKKL